MLLWIGLSYFCSLIVVGQPDENVTALIMKAFDRPLNMLEGTKDTCFDFFGRMVRLLELFILLFITV